MNENLWGADGLPPHNDKETSIEAAEKKQSTVASERDSVYEHIRSRGEIGCTDDELETHFYNIRPTVNSSSQLASLRTRRNELVKMGLVIETDERRKSKSNMNVIVWRAVAPENAVPPQQKTRYEKGIEEGTLAERQRCLNLCAVWLVNKYPHLVRQIREGEQV